MPDPAQTFTLLGMPAQIDLGNFAVGLGTAAVAIVAWRTSRSTAKKEIALARLRWIESLRNELSSFAEIYSRLQHRTVFINGNGKSVRAFKSEDFQTDEFKNMVRSHHRVMFMLNEDEKPHKDVIECMNLMLSGADTPQRSFLDLSRAVCKSEWEKTKKELGKN